MQFTVAYTTLQRHLADHKRTGNEQFFYSKKCAVWTLFSTEEEGKLIDHIPIADHVSYGLTRKAIAKLAYQFANELTKTPGM
jgi:hypothetical protein